MTRSKILLRAAYDLLKKSSDSGYVMEAALITTFYDEAVCDGSCLMQDIADELNLPDGINTDPIETPAHLVEDEE